MKKILVIVSRYSRDNNDPGDFITELSEVQSDDTNVPPENMQASQGMMAPEPDMTNTDAIDQGQTEIA